MDYLNEAQLKEFSENISKIDFNSLFAEIDAQYEKASGEAKITMEWFAFIISKYYNATKEINTKEP